MSKLSSKDADALMKSGILSVKSVEEMQGKGFISKKRTPVRKFMKTSDGKWVTPMLYFRGGKNTKLSKKQTEFVDKFNNLVNKYAVTKTNQ